MDCKCGAMEKVFKGIWLTTFLICVSVNSNAHESIDETTVPSYWVCVPVYVEIDYSYLRKGEWISKSKKGVKQDEAAISFDVDFKSWGLSNCEA